MGYVATTGFILYWKWEEPYYIYIAHNDWFDCYKFSVFTEDEHTTWYLLLQQYPESIIHHLGLGNLVPYELDLTCTPFFYAAIVPY